METSALQFSLRQERATRTSVSEGGEPRRSARVANKRQQTGGNEPQPKRMKSGPSSRVLASAESFDVRLRDVFSFRAAIPVVSDVYGIHTSPGSQDSRCLLYVS